MSFEGVVLPVLHVANHSRSVIEADDQAGILHANGDRPIPGVVVNSGIFFRRERWFRIRGALALGFLYGFRCVFFLRVFQRFECGDPVCRWELKVLVENVIQNGIEGPSLLGIGQHDHAQIFLRHQHDPRDESGNAPGVAD